MSALQEFQGILKHQLDVGDVVALHQPERHVLVSFKMFRYLLDRIAELATPNQDAINAAVEQRIGVIRDELQRQFDQRQARLDLRGARHGTQTTLPAIPPRVGEPQA